MPEIPIPGFLLEVLAAVALARMLSSLDRQHRGPGVRDWALGQWALAAALVASVALSRTPPGSALQAAARVTAFVLAYWAPALVLCGTWARFDAVAAARHRPRLLVALAFLAAATVLASPLAGSAARLVRSGTRSLLTAAAHAAAGGLLLREARRRRVFGARVLALSFLGTAVEEAFFLWLVATGRPTGVVTADLLIEVELLLFFLSGVGMVAWLLEDEREAAVELQRTLQRREALSELGSLVAGVAHEARSPLFGISATLDALQARAGDAAPARHLAAMRDEVARLSRLMSELLEYGRPIAPELVPGSLSTVAANAVAAGAALADATGVRVELRCDRPVPDVRLDPVRLPRAVQNLVQNAVQHTSRGGRVLVDVSPETRDGRLGARCRVSDDGPGFTADDLPHVFEPFFSRRRGGTGLGLSIVRRIVDQHGGAVAAANGDCGGATVSLWLPSA
jgi:signal transduction histidine kinase